MTLLLGSVTLVTWPALLYTFTVTSLSASVIVVWRSSESYW